MVEYNSIRENIKIIHGSLDEELVEQKLSCKYIKPTDTVLEIGGNMGRNALIISSLLKEETNFVTMEPNKNFYNKLKENRDINNKIFHIDNSALSYVPLVSHDSLTLDFNIVEEKFPLSKDHLLRNKEHSVECNIISFKELEKKYNLVFNTLVIDCEGAFYYILKDMPEILKKIKLIIMENDYENSMHYEYIKSIFLEEKFKCIESIPLHGCPWNAPCKDNFYEVWKMDN